MPRAIRPKVVSDPVRNSNQIFGPELVRFFTWDFLSARPKIAEDFSVPDKKTPKTNAEIKIILFWWTQIIGKIMFFPFQIIEFLH